MHPPPPPRFFWGGGGGGGGGVSFLPNFRKGRWSGLAGSQLLEEVGGKEGVTFFRGVVFLFHNKEFKLGNFN